jgi:hypothetical protein
LCCPWYSCKIAHLWIKNSSLNNWIKHEKITLIYR